MCESLSVMCYKYERHGAQSVRNENAPGQIWIDTQITVIGNETFCFAVPETFKNKKLSLPGNFRIRLHPTQYVYRNIYQNRSIHSDQRPRSVPRCDPEGILKGSERFRKVWRCSPRVEIRSESCVAVRVTSPRKQCSPGCSVAPWNRTHLDETQLVTLKLFVLVLQGTARSGSPAGARTWTREKGGQDGKGEDREAKGRRAGGSQALRGVPKAGATKG